MDPMQALAARGVGVRTKRIGSKIPIATIGPLTNVLNFQVTYTATTAAMGPSNAGYTALAQSPGTAIAIYKKDGTLRNTITGPSGTKRLAMDKMDNVYCGAGTQLIKYTIDGAQVWAKTLARDIVNVKFSKDCIYVHYGTTSGTGRISKYDSDGNLAWDVQAPRSGYVGGIEADVNGQLFFNARTYIYKIDKNTGTVSSTLTVTDGEAREMNVDPTGTYLGVGHYNTSTGNYRVSIWRTRDWVPVFDGLAETGSINGLAITANELVAVCRSGAVRLYTFGRYDPISSYGGSGSQQLHQDENGNLLIYSTSQWWRYERYYSIIR